MGLFDARVATRANVGAFMAELATDEDGLPYFSTEGCTQGDPMGPFWFAVGYHEALLRTQAAHPGTTITCYLDDTYYTDEPREGYAAMLTGEEESVRLCGVPGQS